MPNRIFYAVQALAIAKTGHGQADSPEFEVMKGVQSVGISTNFTLDTAFEFGQAEVYANLEDITSVEVTMEKLIDGEKLLYLQATGETGGKVGVVAASNALCDVYLALFDDALNNVAGETKTHVVYCSGMQVSSVGYNYSVDGNATETLTVVGSDKFWDAVTAGYIGASPNTLFGSGGPTISALDGTDSPVSGIVRRGQFDPDASTLPSEVLQQTHDFTVGNLKGLQSITVNADFGREDQTELGRFGVYNKTAQLPFEVTCEFEVTSTAGDQVSVSGIGENLTNRTIILKDDAGTVINLGTKNKLSSINQQGGDTGGGNQTITFSYTTFNDLVVDGGGTYWT